MKKKNNKYILPVMIMVFLLILIIYYAFNIDNGYNKYKVKRNEALVYTYYNKGNISIPYINLDDDAIKTLNGVIIDTANVFLSKNSGNVISYTYELNGKILSLAIEYLSKEGDYPTATFQVYNIRITDYHILDDEEILEMYSVTKEQVRGVVEGKFKEFYKDLYNQKYFDEECNYECFLYMRGMKGEDYLDNSHYYIKQGNLYVIRSFKIYSVFNEEKYFKSSDYLIQITE